MSGAELRHIHGYLWSGSKQRFDQDALRRPPHPEPPPAARSDDVAGQRLVERYREAAAEFPVADLPPISTAHWLLKRSGLIRDTWSEPEGAAGWLGERLAEYAPRFAAVDERAAPRLARLVDSAADRLGRGGDVSLGFYLERPAFLSVALVICLRAGDRPEDRCPDRTSPGRG
ncbi:hypothetical protein [Streptomyces sp. NPDC014894]|uniref:hypothetical protein n=1 Tax=unclassified Streptomyces TaxID=2593676 RepID=UPI0036F9AD67